MSTIIALDDITKNKNSTSKPQENISEDNIDAREVDNTKKYMKCLTSVLAFSIIYGLSSTFTQIGSTYILSQITTIEKTFGLTSASSGLMVSANDIGSSVTILLASHFLQRYHMPRILAICIFMVGVGSLLMTVPHLVKPTIIPKSSPSDSNSSINTASSVLCKPTSNQVSSNASCDPDTHNSSAVTMEGNGWVWPFLFIVILIQGMAKSPRESLSKTYVDNNSEMKKSGFYIGILSTFQLFGPFLGFTLGGFISSLPIDLQETTLTPYDPRWLGAWWLGFLIIGGCCILTSFPICMFPKGQQQPEAQTKSFENENVLKVKHRSGTQEKSSENEKEVQESIWSMAKDFPRSSVRIFKSTVYTLTVLGGITYVFAFITLGSFGPKYLEHQFNQPTYRANIILGGQNLVTTVIGTMLGGILALRLRLDMIGCCKLVILTRMVCIALTAFNYVFGCDNPYIHGYHDTRMGESSLNLTCDCSGQDFLPVCVKDVGTFFSPCHAGCQAVTEQGYTNCSTSGETPVGSRICDTGCNYLIPFVAINALNALIGTVGIAPTYVIYLRSVEERDRSLALGFASLLLSLLVLLPAPILIGNIFDSVCLVWGENCGVKGACTLYDLTQMRLKLVSIDSGLRVLSGCLAISALVFACRQKRREDGLHKRDETSIEFQNTSKVHL